MNDLDLRTALHRDADLVGSPSPDLLDQLVQRRQHQRRQRAGMLTAALAVVVIGAGIPVGNALLAPSSGSAASPGEITTPSVEEQLDSLAADFGITDPPDVPIIQLVTPETRGALVEACLAGRGYSLTDGWYEVPGEDTDAFDLANYVCMASYPIDPSYVEVPADEDLWVD